MPSEPQPGAGSLPRATTILGVDKMIKALINLQAAVDNLAKLEKDNAGPVQSFKSHPETRNQWRNYRAAQNSYNKTAVNKREMDATLQSASQGQFGAAIRGLNQERNSLQNAAAAFPRMESSTPSGSAWGGSSVARQRLQTNASQNAAYGNGMRAQANASNVGFPPSIGSGLYNGGVTPGTYISGGNTSPTPWSSGAWQGGSGFSAPVTPGTGGSPAKGGVPRLRLGQGSPNGGVQAGGGAGIGGGGGGLGGGAGGGGIKSFISENKTQLGVGLAAGAMTAAGNAIDSYSTRMLNTNYDQFGNLVVLRNGGYSGKTYGDASSQGIDKLRSSRFIATSPADLINGGSQILANSNNQTFGQNLTNAGVSAYLSPGMGLGQTATNQQQEGTNKANVISQMMFGIGTRTPGGGQTSETDIANAALNTTRGGQGMTGMTPDKLAAMLQQGGSLRTNLNTYASNAGLGPEAVDSLANILQAQTAYQAKYGSTTDFQSTVSAASQGDKAAQAKLKGTGIGESVEQSVLNRQGTQINRDMNSQATYIDTLKKTNEVMQQLSDTLTAFMKNTGLDKALGMAGGANAGSGGRVGSTLKGAAVGAALGSFIGPEGTVLGGLAGGAYGFITGGAENPVKSGSTATQNAAPAATSGAATSAASFAVGQVGKPYVSGATGPNAYDCSGLMMAAYKQAGVSIPRVSSTQSQFGVAVPPNQIGPGDLIFPRGYDGMNGAPAGLPGHVVMALSGGPNIQVVEAGSPQTGVYTTTMSIGDVESARRVTGGVGTLAPNLNVSATGASNTNTATTAGKAQASGSGGSRGMNEIDVLGSVLGSSGFQSPATLAGSAQKTGQLSVNGTANKNPSYSKGAYSIDGDQLANLHDGETVLDSKLSRSMRAALMADIPNHTSPGSGGTSVNFASGAISISVTGAMTAGSATSAAKQFADAVAADDRIQLIGRGL